MAKQKEETESTELVTTGGGEAAVPAFGRRDGPIRGLDGIRSEHIILPAVFPIQNTHTLDGPDGAFWHNIREAVIDDFDDGEPGIDAIPIISSFTVTLWRPLHDGDGGMLAKASDGINWDEPNQEFEIKPHDGISKKVVWRIGKRVDDLTMCPDAQGRYTKSIASFGTYDPDEGNVDGNPPAAVSCFNFICRSYKHFGRGKFILRFQKTSFGAGRMLQTKMLDTAQEHNVDTFMLRFRIGSRYVDKGTKQKFWVLTSKNNGMLEEGDEAKYDTLAKDYEFLSKNVHNIVADEEPAPAPANTAPASDTPDEM
jgi:hypothetical protein